MARVTLKFYPDNWRGAVTRVMGDILVLAWTVAGVLAGVAVHQLIYRLGGIAQAVTDLGRTMNSWLEAFRTTPFGSVPGLGNAFNDYTSRLVDRLQAQSGNQAVRIGTDASSMIPGLALILALAVAVLPILVVTVHYVHWRWRDARGRGSLLAYLRGASASSNVDDLQAVLALRAVATLPLPVLAEVSANPIQDLRSGRHRALSIALLSDSGLREARLATAPALPEPPT
jgi:hypothetical protein